MPEQERHDTINNFVTERGLHKNLFDPKKREGLLKLGIRGNSFNLTPEDIAIFMLIPKCETLGEFTRHLYRIEAGLTTNTP